MSDEPISEQPIDPIETVEPASKPAKSIKNPSADAGRAYFFPNDGQPFSCRAASQEEADALNTAYLQTLEETN